MDDITCFLKMRNENSGLVIYKQLYSIQPGIVLVAEHSLFLSVTFHHALSSLSVGFIPIRKAPFFSSCRDKRPSLLASSSVNVYKISSTKTGKVNLNVKSSNFARVFYYGYTLNTWLLLNEN